MKRQDNNFSANWRRSLRPHHGATEVLDERVLPQLARIMQTMGWELDEAGHLAPTKEENDDD